VSAGTAWAVVVLCAIVTAVIKGLGPFALGGRELPEWFRSVVALLAPALLAALVVTQALADGDRLAVGADTAGVAAAGLVLWRGGSILLGVAVAAAVAAALRAAGA
jgi:branched-subunit amino acid transport protein